MQSCSGSRAFTAFSDEELAALAQNGQADAFNALVVRYVVIVNMRVSCYRGTGIEPEDLAQEGMIGLMSAVRSFRPDTGACFRTFAWLCIDRSVLSALKAPFRKKRIPDAKIFPLEENPCGDAHESAGAAEASQNPEHYLIAKEDAKNFWQGVKRVLSPFEHSVLLRFLGGEDYRGIARQLDATVKSVDNAIQRVRRKLR
ncbi:MAG TPA: hypothetical protein DEQ02_05795 [Ruminococcaceae bacterium]|nr:hypothetical protein [Oscillospiraceae bacterium]